ncbi:MAG: hypothetical protein F9K37_12705 [Bacteroidales bacterium]|nr:MAG: hypothetical protein F9K37_12705 [Bacteroidales bacterium]
MAQTINVNLTFNHAMQSNVNFVSNFKQDFTYCISRFNAKVVFNDDSKVDTPFDYHFIVVSNSDFYDSAFSTSLKDFIGDDRKTFVILLDPIKTSSDKIAIKRFVNYIFWDQVVETGESRLYRKDDKSTVHFYWERLSDIVFDILDTGNSKKGIVYLAQTDDSQNQDRDNIKRDLSDLGYLVKPEKLISNNFEESITQVKESLSNSELIIHLIPSTYSEYFSGKGLSIVEHQCNISAKHINKGGKSLHRIIWIPSDFEVIDEQNQIFIEKIQRDHEHSNNTTVLKVNLEDLKKIYRKILLGDNTLKEDNLLLPDLYVIADQDQSPLTNKIDNEAKNAGLKFGVNYKGISYNEHLKYLASAQVVILNYSQENSQWINVKVHDILKSPGLEVSKPKKKLILIKHSKDLDTRHFEMYFNEIHVVDANNLKLNILS